MKSDATHMTLVFALGVCVVLDVLFAVRAVSGQHDLRNLQIQGNQAQLHLMQLQQFEGIVSDIKLYNQQHPSPELTRMLASLQPKPATR